MNITSAQNSGMFNVNRTLDNTPKASGDAQGVGRAENAELASGRDVNPAVAQSSVDQATEAAATKVVNQTDEVLGNLIDTRA
ncbi:hypothetical protein [Marinobacterium weihaiense]|uniref:Uncharacterized protein n=1 Tax=Marinobacterium weihaiense TaxID=2851016 RepID=A0ABS6MAX0_9GAMM|nr:hypothetical protein [Marinobacterium weihaiense]MBV0933438.1 hypothetical protein [Marinobacterium weihaiense]